MNIKSLLPPRKKGSLIEPTPYTPPHKISILPDTKWGKKRHSNYKPQNVILSKNYACLLEVRCVFLQGREARHINTPVPKQGLAKKDNNKHNELKEVEDTNMKIKMILTITMSISIVNKMALS